MKIAITTNEETIEGKVDQRFGRCKNFLVVDIKGKEIKEVKSVANQVSLQRHGADIRAAQQLGELNVKSVITGALGPNETNIIKQLNINSYQASGTIKKAIEDFINERLQAIIEVAPSHNSELAKNNDEHSKDNNDEKENNNEKIFFPLLDENGLDSKISEHFGHAPVFGSYSIKTKELKLIKNDLDHQDPNKSPIEQIQETVNPDVIFARGIGSRAINLAKEKGIAIKTGKFSTVKEVLEHLDELQNQEKDCGGSE